MSLIGRPRKGFSVMAYNQQKIDRQKKEFERTAWEGCAHLDCLPGCSLNPDSWRCVQFERAFEAWAGTHPSADRNADEKAAESQS